MKKSRIALLSTLGILLALLLAFTITVGVAVRGAAEQAAETVSLNGGGGWEDERSVEAPLAGAPFGAIELAPAVRA